MIKDEIQAISDSAARIEALLSAMTLAEKVGQLVQVTPFTPFDPESMFKQMKLAEASGQLFEFEPSVRPDLEDLIRAGKVGSILARPT